MSILPMHIRGVSASLIKTYGYPCIEFTTEELTSCTTVDQYKSLLESKFSNYTIDTSVLSSATFNHSADYGISLRHQSKTTGVSDPIWSVYGLPKPKYIKAQLEYPSSKYSNVTICEFTSETTSDSWHVFMLADAHVSGGGGSNNDRFSVDNNNTNLAYGWGVNSTGPLSFTVDLPEDKMTNCFTTEGPYTLIWRSILTYNKLTTSPLYLKYFKIKF